MRKLFRVFNAVAAMWLVMVAGVNAKNVEARLSFQFQLDEQAIILYESSTEVNDYIIALGKYKKRDNRWLPKQSLRAQGQLTRYTLELAKHNYEGDVFEFYREQVPTGAELLFSCSGRVCGESNNWANDHFGVKQLYGANASQHYAVFVLKNSLLSEENISYITIYTVRRGNRRLYTQLDVLTVRP